MVGQRNFLLDGVLDQISVGNEYLFGFFSSDVQSTFSGNEGCESDCSCALNPCKEMGAMAPPDVNDMILEGDAGCFSLFRFWLGH